MLSVIVHGGGVKIILILQIDSCKTNCSLCFSNWFNPFSSLWKFQGRVLTHTQRIMPFPKSGLEGQPVPGPLQECRIWSATKSRACSQERQEAPKEMKKVAKAVLFIPNSNGCGSVNIHISLRCFHASAAARGKLHPEHFLFPQSKAGEFNSLQ